MPLKLNVGFSRKVGEANFGSRGASVHLELEAEMDLVREPEKLHEKIRHLFRLAKASIDDELNGNGQEAPPPHHNRITSHLPTDSDAQPNGPSGRNGHRATEKQHEYLSRLVRQIPGLDSQKLAALAEKMFAKPVAELTSLDASGLIDTLKSIKAGDIDLDSALNGATT